MPSRALEKEGKRLLNDGEREWCLTKKRDVKEW